ncbi:MAG TPA: Gfo/Idh/MocA family oxidoreductase [Verrucomicrobiota bacterium]|nr:MAG: 1,5-anhydro-D-fructose reductase [Verrucomicrobia bacterium ADurb.Bin118]HPY31933.1 Gfo/Idh/MocA family oxidoreductase [Verrucomicrobiota bacterium]HQB16779.1 Gfo/Idh/MocA family oxidoreductase [Verrucomicrobiota bacterium]
MDRTLKLALVGAGMFGGDVHLRVFAGLQRFGLAGQLARLGFDAWTRALAPVQFELAAVGTRSAASARRAIEVYARTTSSTPRAFHGETPWVDILRAFPDLDVLAVATPDHLHTAPILAALQAGAHVLTEKPMCLLTDEADQIIALAQQRNRVVAVDMHKRYDPDHQRIRDILARSLGEPLYGLAYLEEPLQVATQTFQWVEHSDPFSYVGTHWVDLIWHYYRSKPVSLTAVGQKKRLIRDGINAYDAVQVRVDYANGMSMHFHNHWITPPDFEGPVNQGHELVGTEGKVESDQQYRGLRWWTAGGGSRTANTHFIRAIQRADGSAATVGYGVDSLIAGLAAICRVRFLGESREAVAAMYPTAEDSRITTAIIHAARIVRDLNYQYQQAGQGAPVSARFGADGITIVDPHRAGDGQVFERIYDRAI